MIFSKLTRKNSRAFTTVSSSLLSKSSLLVKWEGICCIMVNEAFNVRRYTMSVSWVCYRGYNSPRKLDNVFHASMNTSSVTDTRKKETAHSEFVILRLQANPTAAERASNGKYWSRSVSVIQAQFYYYEDRWIEVDELWSYNV